MRKIEKRAVICMALAILLAAGMSVFLIRCFAEGGKWASSAFNRHLYDSNGVLISGTVLDRDGDVLSSVENGHRTYYENETVRKATLHAVGDLYGKIGTGVLNAFADKLTGFDLVNGAFGAERGSNLYLTLDANALVAVVGALADDACCRYITGFQRMHECFAVYVYEHCAQRTYFLGYQSTEDLSRVSSSGRMVLNGILIQKRSACTVSKDQTVSGCTVMVGCREVVVVKTSRTTCCDDNGFCLCYLVYFFCHN